MVTLPRDREYPLPVEEMETAIERGEYTVTTRMDGVMVIRDKTTGLFVGKDIPERAAGDIKTGIRAAMLRYMDEGGFEKVKAALNKHLAADMPQWQVIKLLLEYSVGPPQQELGNNESEVIKHLIDRMVPQIATVSTYDVEGESRDV